MSPRTRRIIKEARALFWPWCVLIMIGSLRLLQEYRLLVLPVLVDFWVGFGFWLGVPLLATLSFGNEFQHRTLSIMLTQPISRFAIWVEKLSVMMVAALSVGLVFYIGWRPALQQSPFLWMLAAGWFISSICSAFYWTLVTGSIGGIVGQGVGPVSFMIAAFAILGDPDDWRTQEISAVLTIATVAIPCYAGMMLWLGWRQMTRLQATAEATGWDLLLTARNLNALFRPRPNRAWLNLILKELRILWPLWVIPLTVWAFCLAVVGVVAVFLGPPSEDLLTEGSIPFLVIYAILAGSLSVGEERRLGTQLWHLTFPVSARRQWLIKLATASFAAFLWPVVSVVANNFYLGTSFNSDDLGLIILVAMPVFPAFWCACAARGTLPAVVWVFPALLFLGVSVLLGGLVGGLARIGTLQDLIVSQFHPFRFEAFNSLLTMGGAELLLAMRGLIALLLLGAAVQSYRLFRAEPQDNLRSVARRLLPLAILAFFGGFSFRLFENFVERAHSQAAAVLRETHEAALKLQLDATKLDAAHPQRLTMDDLAKVSPLSEPARRWLRNSGIAVAPNNFPTKGSVFERFSKYFTIIHLSNGWDCTAYGLTYWDCVGPSGRHAGTVPAILLTLKTAKP